MPTAPAAPAPVHIPTPEDLGIGGAAPVRSAELDWTTTRRRLQELGATRFQLEHTGSAARFSVWLPGQAGAQPVQAEAPTENEAVARCLARASEHTSRKR
jgi:hypothetical protein